MPEEHAKSFGGGLTETTLNPIVLAAMVVAIVCLLCLPRKYAVLPILLIHFLTPLGQAIVVAGVHLFVVRIIVLVGLSRYLFARPHLAGGINAFDKAFFWCCACQAVAAVILFASSSALIFEVGFLIDWIGPYVLLRILIQNREDIHRVLKCLAFVSVILAATMVVEQVKLVNVFYFIGGDRLVPEVRDGKIRAQGVFLHQLCAGAFAATLAPLFLLLWQKGGSKTMAFVGIIGSTVMMYTTNSSTSLLAYAGAVVAICLWPIRRSMQLVRRIIVTVLISLHFVMKAPVWFLIARIDLTGGSSGYHRALLIDQFIRHFTDWCLIGVKDTGTWGWDLWDAQNQFVNIGETGGLVAFCFFIALLSRAFTTIGKARKSAEGGDRLDEWQIWVLGVALFSHIVAFFGVNYFDQSRVGFFLVFAMISALTAAVAEKALKLPATGPDICQNADMEFHPALSFSNGVL